MNARDRKKLIIIVCAILSVMFIYIVISTIVNRSDRNISSNSDETFISNSNRSSYDFSETLNLEVASGVNEETKSTTDQPDFGVFSEFYDDVDIEQVGDTIVMEVPSGGYMTIALYWMDDGLAQKIKEPEFGSIEKFFLNPDGSITANYFDVTLKDMKKYMNELSALGFNDIVLDNQNKKKDFYYYSAKNKDGVRVTLNYENGNFSIGVFK